MTVPYEDIAGCHLAHVRLGEVVRSLSDDDIARSSGLPAWTVGHVLVHLAQNARAMQRRIVAAMRSEVEVHLVDLDCGVTPEDWSDGLVDRSLTRLLAGLPDRADHRALMAWLLGRGPAPDLDPWG